MGADVVTADGRFLHVSADQNEDLYWGIRGGGGNFGIVTNFEMQLHPMQRTVVAGSVLFPADVARDVFQVYRERGMSAPDDLYVDPMIMQPLGAPGAMAGFEICYSGPEKDAEKLLQPYMSIAEPVMNTVKATDYVEAQRAWDNTDPRNDAEYFKSGFINDFPDDLLDNILDGFDPKERRGVMLYMQQSGGAIGRVPVEATAFAHRKSIANMFVSVTWPKEDDPTDNVRYIREYWGKLETATDGYYTVDSADESREIRHGNYQGNFPRLLEIKKKYDPTNLFRLNANINPAA